MGAARFLVSPARVFARPTADQIWLGPAQQSALSQFSGTHKVRLLAGPPSSGKSTLVAYFASQLPPESVVLQCRGPKDDATAVLTGLLLSADLAPWELSEIERRNLLTVFIHQRRSQGRRVVLVVDDAHAFKDAAWEELERLLAFKIDKHPALELLLAGPSSLAERLNADGHESNQIRMHTLETPSLEDLASYVHWRLSRFEMQDFVTPVASQMIARLSAGRYAAVNVLCQMSLLLLRQLGLERADARVVRQAAAALTERQATKMASTEAPSSDAALDVPPQGYLLISRGGKVLDRVTLGQRTLLGRSEHNDVCLPSPYLSRHHAVIVGTPEGYYAVDLNSVNGLLVNGEQVARAVLCDQDILTLGPFRMKVQIPEWIAHGSPLPDHESLAETAVMPPQQPQKSSSVRRVK
jgi:type II secretory pathway predicted ATPase ExeA